MGIVQYRIFTYDETVLLLCFDVTAGNNPLQGTLQAGARNTDSAAAVLFLRPDTLPCAGLIGRLKGAFISYRVYYKVLCAVKRRLDVTFLY